MRSEQRMTPKQQWPKNPCRVLVTGLKFLYKAAAAGAPPDAIAPANRSGSSSLQQCKEDDVNIKAVLRIRIHMFLGLPDPNPLVRGMDPDPSIIMQK
jgi:hypothetical protein